MNQTDSWSKLKESLKKTQPQHAYATWFEPLVCIGLNNKNLIVEVPNQFFFEWIQSHYKETIQSEVVKIYGATREVKYTVSPEGAKKTAEVRSNIQRSSAQLQTSKNLKINEKYTFSAFIEGSNNQFAKAAALNVSETLGQQAFNPLVIYGGVGMGKTHLLHAIGNKIAKANTQENIVCASSEKFTLDFISSIQKNKTVEFSKSFRNTDILLIDDIQFMNGKEQCKRSFFIRLMNYFRQANKL